MAENWLKELHLRECCDGTERNQWIASGTLGIKGLAWDKAAEFYPQIFERRFRGDPESGFASLETAMDGKEPSLGYSRGDWNFDALFAATLPGLLADVRALYEALGAAILDEQALPMLEQNKLWQKIVAQPWPSKVD